MELKYAKADPLKRFIAIVIDNVMCSMLALLPIWGAMLAAAYLLLRDGFNWRFMHYRSLGKQLMKLKVVPLQDHYDSPMVSAIKRNWLLTAPALLSLIPIVPLPITFGLGLAVLILEGLNVLRHPQGRRWGDRWAGTQVVNTPSQCQPRVS